jgi:hypothetical protein
VVPHPPTRLKQGEVAACILGKDLVHGNGLIAQTPPRPLPKVRVRLLVQVAEGVTPEGIGGTRLGAV